MSTRSAARRLGPAITGAVIAAALAVSAVAADSGSKILEGSMTGIPQGGLAISGVAGGGLPWVLDRGSVELSSSGKLELSVRHLVLAAGANAGTNPVPTGRAIVVCAGAAPVMSDTVPYSPDGNARVETRLSLPSPCLAPVVFFAGQTANGPRWFAVSGG
jgi:hypothetical protein